MLQVARLAPQLLGESAALVLEFVRAQRAGDGGFRDRKGESDLYYTVFGLGCLQALQADPAAAMLAPYLAAYGDGEGLDLVHLSCLARAYAALDHGSAGVELGRALGARLARFRTPDGGYSSEPEGERGTVYGCFLALGMSQDLAIELDDAGGMAAFVESMARDGGGYANEAAVPLGTTPATAAAVALLRHLGRAPGAAAGDWLAARFHPGGGFLAVERAPMPDLLSTAVALHSLASLERSLDDFAEPSLDYIDSLWTNRGGFYGTWADEYLDCEYTFYGLLALGHLSLYT
jgi:prenyltransferase beta subunit